MGNKIIAGDFEGGEIFKLGRDVTLYKNGESIKLSKDNVKSIELVTEENKKELFGAAGWGLAGTALLGPLGLIAGVLIGGNRKEVTFVCHLQDGRKFMAITGNNIYQYILALLF